MKSYEKEVELAKLKAEEKELKHLKAIYDKAADDIMKKIEISNGKISVLLANWDDLTDEEKSIYQSQIYQRNFQKSLKTQIDGFLKDLNSKQYATMTEYMEDCYKNGYLGAMYSIHKQGIPIISPIDQKKVTKAMFTDSAISKKLYTRLGEDVELLKKRIANNLSRGIATASEYSVIARNIAADSNVGFNRAMRIARTEGGRISNESAYDASIIAKEKGADVVKCWDAALDGRTRESHRRVDGEIRELDEKFSNGMMFPSDSAGGAAEVVNCRCALLQRAKWALDEDELQTLKDRAAFYGLDKTESFKDFQKKYLKAAEAVQDTVKSMPKGFVPAKTIEEAETFAKQFVVEKTWSGNGNVSYKGLSLESANKMNETLAELFDQNELPRLSNIQPMNFRQNIWKGSETTPMAYRNLSSGELYFNPKIMKNEKTVAEYFAEGKKAFKICKDNIDKFTGKDRELIETYLKSGLSIIAEYCDDGMKAMIQHELGHHIQNQLLMNSEEMMAIVKEGYEKYAVKISGYATKTYGEYIAESFSAYKNGKGDIIDHKLKAYFEGLVK